MKEIYSKIIELLEKNRFSVLATMIRQAGPAPRGVGTKFLIMKDGSFVGTIGGGLLEAQVLKGADKVFEKHSPLRLNFVLKGKDVAETDMLCGGDVEVFLEPISSENLDYLHIYRRVMELNRRGGSGVVATLVDVDHWQAGQNHKMFLAPDGQRIGSLLGVQAIEADLMEMLDQVLSQGRPNTIICRDDRGNELEIFVEPVVSEPILYVFGGGHVSSQIVPLASKVGFEVVVIDDRPEFADPNNFPEASKVYQYPFEAVFERISADEFSYLVIVTRGHIHDKTVLAQCLKTRARYIGMIGSRRKRNMIYNSLMGEGFTQEDLNRVHSPIGVDIGAETPEEIAVSIVAELIKVRARYA